MAECSKETKMLLDLESKSLSELKEFCRICGVKVGGRKSELIQRLIPYYGPSWKGERGGV